MADQSKPQTSDFVEGRVKVDVKVIKAVDLKIEGKESDKLNPYVAVTLGSDELQKFKTKIIRHDPNPVWNETFTFNVNNLENEVIYVDMKSKGNQKSTPIMKRVKISFISFQYGETKEVEKELHWKDEYVGKLFLQISLRNKRKNTQTKSKEVKPQESPDKKYDLNVKLIDCDGFKPEEEPIKCDLQINQESAATSKKSKNLKWNQNIVVPFDSFKKDVFTIKPSKGDGIAIPLNTLKLNETKEYHEDIPNTDDCTIHFTLQPVEHGKPKERAVSKGPKCQGLDLGDYSSMFSTSFTSLTSSFQQSVSEMRDDEEGFHSHKDLEQDQTEKPCRYDSVKGSLKSLSDLVDVGSSSSKLYVTLDVLSLGKQKKIKTKKSKKVDPTETPSLSFDLQRIKKGNTLVFNIWKTVSGSDPANIGIVEIPVKDIPENKDKKKTYDIQEPPHFSYGEHDNFGTAVFQLNHTVEYSLPYETAADNDDN
ncbi:hypothetical protein M9Y10_028879 [Tritrichomonas musculus]|uniref:C2 domain-containing protein n=1 Tax=Tritrichomonas musculus TaxID=1915356 RepID=A0ABR2KKK9_9EUKA